jgi:hypothetical protein
MKMEKVQLIFKGLRTDSIKENVEKSENISIQDCPYGWERIVSE